MKCFDYQNKDLPDIDFEHMGMSKDHFDQLVPEFYEFPRLILSQKNIVEQQNWNYCLRHHPLHIRV